jgi:hypothetical protein
MQNLSPDDRKFVLAYHSPKGRRVEERKRLAQENGISMVALRVRANRLRFKLEECLKRCLAETDGLKHSAPNLDRALLP